MLLTASLIHDGRKFLPHNTVIEIEPEGAVLAVRPLQPGDEPVVFPGWLCPGFVNVHCHLELSHLHGRIPQHTGLPGFLHQVVAARNACSETEMKEARHQAYEDMLRQGIVAVGDIANTHQTADLREKDQLHIHTFIEALGFAPGSAFKAWEQAGAVCQKFSGQEVKEHMLRQSITPHAPYSVSESLFRIINQYHSPGLPLSVHNQETEGENLLYRQGKGPVAEFLSSLGIDTSHFMPSGKNSLPTYGDWIDSAHPLILVHNTFTGTEDILYAAGRSGALYFCLCPNANLYIENRLPDVPRLDAAGAKLCIGTDSLASNRQLSVLAELQTIRKYFQTDWEKLLCWATANGAEALQMEDRIGTLVPGRKPGILHLPDPDSSLVINRVV